MFGRKKKKCKKCDKELVEGRDVGPWCEVCTIDVLQDIHNQRNETELIDYSNILPGSDEYHNLHVSEKIACLKENVPNWENLNRAEKDRWIYKWQKGFDLDD